MTSGFVRSILSHSSVDGPGNRVVIFLQGCNFNCLYCHNPETIAHYRYISETQQLTPSDVMSEVMKYRNFISGITVSGGECSLQIEFLTELFRLAKNEGLTTFADSNGSRNCSDFDDFLSVCDSIMLDVKSFNSLEHQRLTGADNNIVLDNLNYLAKINKLYEVRTVIVPDLLNNENTVNEVSKILANINPDIRYKLIKFRAHGVRDNLHKMFSPSDEYMDKLTKIACDNGCQQVLLV